MYNQKDKYIIESCQQLDSLPEYHCLKVTIVYSLNVVVVITMAMFMSLQETGYHHD